MDFAQALMVRNAASANASSHSLTARAEGAPILPTENHHRGHSFVEVGV